MVDQAADTLYLAGPMRGIPFYNAPAFDNAAKALRKRGYTIVSPADLDRDEYDVDFSLCPTGTEDPALLPPLPTLLLRDLWELSKCDGIALLPGYEKSKGAMTELAFAKFCDLKILHYTPEEQSLWYFPQGQQPEVH